MKKFKGQAVYLVEADNIDEAKDLANDKAFLMSMIPESESGCYAIENVKCTDVTEVDETEFEFSCVVEGKANDRYNLGDLGITLL